MSPEFQTVLEISLTGGAILFVALGGLVGLMYLLTWSWLYGGSRGVEAAPQPPIQTFLPGPGDDEQDRRRRAAAVAVGLACAEVEAVRSPMAETPAAWRQFHRARRLGQPTARVVRR